MKIAFDVELVQPGCAIIQAAMGGTLGIANKFNSEDWLVVPTSGMKLYEVTEEQLIFLVQKVEGRI